MNALPENISMFVNPPRFQSTMRDVGEEKDCGTPSSFSDIPGPAQKRQKGEFPRLKSPKKGTEICPERQVLQYRAPLIGGPQVA